MQEKNVIHADERSVENNFEQLVNEAYKLFPNLRSDLKAVSDANISIDAYRQYIDIMNQSPAVITTNHVS